MTTEHDEGFAAGIEAAAKLADHAMADAIADAIRNLKPAPRSAEHTAEPSAQSERERFEALLDKHADLAVNRKSVLENHKTLLAAYDALAAAPSTRIEAEPVVVLDVPDLHGPNDGLKVFYKESVFKLARGQYSLYLAPPDRTPDARSTSDAAVVLPRWTEIERKLVEDESALTPLERFIYDEEPASHEQAAFWRASLQAAIADRATRSTDSSAEAAGMERAAKWVDDRADAYDRDHGQTDPDTGTRWWPGDGEDYMFELDEIATGIRAEAAKLTTAPHTADETRDAGHDADDAADFKRRGDRDDRGMPE